MVKYLIFHTQKMVRFETIYTLNIVAATVHAVSGFVVFGRAFYMQPMTLPSGYETVGNQAIGPYLPAVCFRSRGSNGIPPLFFVEPQLTWDLKVYTAVLVTMFFLLSAGFQAFQAINKDAYRQRVESNGTNFLRYIEYSFSASVMMVCVATTLMIFDLFTHMLIFTCTFTCMLLGLLADCLRTNARQLQSVLRDHPTITIIINTVDELNELKWKTHYLSWATFLKPYVLVYGVSYFRTVYRAWDCLDGLPTNEPTTPVWVHVVVVSQFVLFSCFGVVQYLQFNAIPDTISIKSLHQELEDDKRIGTTTEFSFIFLSLTAKSILGWLVAGNFLFVET